MHLDQHAAPPGGSSDREAGTTQQGAPGTADDLLTLIERLLPGLWQAHATSGSRALRTLLHVAERLLAQRAGVDVRTFRDTRRAARRPRR